MKQKLVLILFVVMASLSTVFPLMGQTAKVYEEEFTMKTYPFSDPNPVPEVNRIYPYFYFHGYTNVPVNQKWKMVILENDYIKVFICPDIGGKIWGAIEKSTGKEFLYYNDVVKFRDVAMRGAWTSGGLEYNFGDIGHIPTCATPVDYVMKENVDGSVSCIVGAEDLPSGSRWSIEIVVEPAKAFFETKVSWHNTAQLPCTYYHWMNAAAKADGDLEFIYPGNKRIGHGGEVAEWPIDKGRELNYYRNNNFGSYKSYHIINAYSDFFGGYWHEDDFGFGHWANYDEKPGKKLWIWGLAPEGMIWEDLLTDDDGQYIEFQAGKLFNQAAHSSTLTPFKHQEFSPFDADIMNEIWFPVKGTKGIKAASKYAVLNIIEGDRKNKLYLNALQSVNAPLRIIEKEGKVVFSRTIELSALELFETDFEVEGDFTVELGEQLLYYSSEKEDVLVNRPVNANPHFNFNSSYGLYVRGLEFEKQRRYREAKDAYEQSLEKEPAYVPALNRLAQAYIRQGEDMKAWEYLQKSLSVDTYDGEANYLYGIASSNLKNTADAKSAFSIASASVKYRSAAYTQLASIFLNEKDYVRSREYAEKARSFNKFNLVALKILALNARAENRIEDAAQLIAQISQVDAVDLFKHFENYFLNPTDNALEEIRRAVSSELPYESYLSVASFYNKVGFYSEALEVLNVAPQTPIILLWKASLDSLNNQNYTEQLVAASPEFVFPHRIETVRLLEKTIQRRKHWKLRYYLGLAYWNLGLIDEAKNQFVLCEMKPDYAPFYLAKSKLFKEDLKTVEACYAKARRLAPNDWRGALAQIKLNINKKEFKKAFLLSGKFLEKYPEKGELGMSYAQALIGLERFEEVVAFLDTFNVLPYEGATIGRHVYHEACIRAGMNAMKVKEYSSALEYIDKARKWPVNLGVGQPFDVDERIELILETIVYKKMGRESDAVGSLRKVSAYKHPEGVEENSKLLLQLKTLTIEGKKSLADELLDKYIDMYPDSKYLQWVNAKFRHPEKAYYLKKEILDNIEETQPYDIAFVDEEFGLTTEVVSFVEYVSRNLFY